MAKIIGCCMLAFFGGAVLTLMARDIGLRATLMIYGASLAIAAWIGLAAYLIAQ